MLSNIFTRSIVLIICCHASVIAATSDGRSLVSENDASLSVWQFIGHIAPEFVPQPILGQLEAMAEGAIAELAKYRNLTNATGSYALQNIRYVIDDDDDPSEIFQQWLDETITALYEWTQEDVRYRSASTDIKALRNWIRGLDKYRFSQQHVQVFIEFYRKYAAQENVSSLPSEVASAFRRFVNNEIEQHTRRVRRHASSGALLVVDEYRSLFQPTRNKTAWWSYLLEALDWFEDGVVIYNRMQTNLWPIKLALSFTHPSVKFVWTAVDVAACVFEETYELGFAVETEDRWYDMLLCSLELLGIIPGGGAVKFGIRVALRLLKLYFGINKMPWYGKLIWKYTGPVVTGAWNGLKNWWSGSTASTATALTRATTQRIPTTTLNAVLSLPAGISGEILHVFQTTLTTTARVPATSSAGIGEDLFSFGNGSWGASHHRRPFNN